VVVSEQLNDLEDELVKYVKRELLDKIKYGFKFDKTRINVNIPETADYPIFFVIKYEASVDADSRKVPFQLDFHFCA